MMFACDICRVSNHLGEKVCVICCEQLVNYFDVAMVIGGKDMLIEFTANYGYNELVQYLVNNPAVIKVHN